MSGADDSGHRRAYDSARVPRVLQALIKEEVCLCVRIESSLCTVCVERWISFDKLYDYRPDRNSRQRLLQPSEAQSPHDALFVYDMDALRGGFRSLVDAFPCHFLHCYAGMCLCSFVYINPRSIQVHTVSYTHLTPIARTKQSRLPPWPLPCARLSPPGWAWRRRRSWSCKGP